MQNTNRIVFNTLINYVKSAFTITIALYSTRIILNTLGAADFGLFNVVGGLVGMLTFLNAAMATSTQRYISYSLGKNETAKVKSLFANSSILHYAIGVLLVIVIELAGLYLINRKLEINIERLETANLLFHFVVISTFISVISVPFDAVINAHENMLFLAIVGIFETLLKLGIAIQLTYTSGDKLVVFGLLTMFSSVIIILVKRIYSRNKYAETRVSLQNNYNSDEIKELTTFAGWNLLGILSYIGRNQGMAVILNLFFSTVVNAAYGIASQVNSQLSFFSTTIMQAIQPQMVKSEGAGDRGKLITLAIFSSKISFFLFAFVAIPIYIEIPVVLKLWLKNIPDNTVIFCRLIILLTLILQLRTGITTAVHAIGNIKKYQLLNSPVQLLNLPIGYILFNYDYPPYSIIVVSIITEGIVLMISINFFAKLTGYSGIRFFKNVLFPCFFILITTYLIVSTLSSVNQSYLHKLILFILSSCVYLGLFFFIGLDKNEKNKINILANSLRFKLTKHTLR